MSSLFNLKFQFGKYKGRSIATVPKDYLQWFMTTEVDERYRPFRDAVEAQLAAWQKQRKKTPKG